MSAVIQAFTPDRRPAPRPAVANWNTNEYLAAYYSRLEPTEKHTLRFLVDTLRARPPVDHALDFGSGPTLHHAMALVARTRELHLADLDTENLRAIRHWMNGLRRAHDWSPFTREVLRLEGAGPAGAAQVEERAALLRRRMTRLIAADVRHDDPLGRGSRGFYGCVTSFFCADSATRDLYDWRRWVRNIAGLLAPGGLLILGALRCCDSWRLGNAWLPSPCLDECHLQFVLDSAGFDQLERKIEVVALPDQKPNGFESMLLVAARSRRNT